LFFIGLLAIATHLMVLSAPGYMEQKKTTP